MNNHIFKPCYNKDLVRTFQKSPTILSRNKLLIINQNARLKTNHTNQTYIIAMSTTNIQTRKTKKQKIVDDEQSPLALLFTEQFRDIFETHIAPKLRPKSELKFNGNSLAPEGLDLKVVRYFPLANVLHAFDAGICATGYNGVHELLPAQVPTVFVSNIRGTDDQEARAKWCNDFGFALRADQADHEDITSKVKMLQDPAIRARLSAKCAELPETSGGDEIAAMLYKLAVGEKPKGAQNLTFIRLTIQERLNRGLRNIANLGLRRIAIIYRILNPHIVTQMVRVENPIFGSQTTSSELHQLIKGDVRFEHIISGASDVYRKRREEIADAAYGKRLEVSKK